MGNILKKQKINSINEEITSEAPPWGELPTPAINEIYKNLSDVDKLSMSMVCKTWNEGFNDPSLWRDRVFQFEGCNQCDLYELERFVGTLIVHSGKVSLRFAKIFSRHLKKVEIHIFPPFLSSSEGIKDLNKFSELFDYSELKKIHIISLKVPSFNERQKLNAEFIKIFIRLFERQNSLEELEICGVYFDLAQGVQLLMSLAESCGETLQKLHLKMFLASRFQTVSLTGPVINEIKSLVTQMRSEHCPINSNFHRLDHNRDSNCRHCSQASETVVHMLTSCPALDTAGEVSEAEESHIKTMLYDTAQKMEQIAQILAKALRN